MRDFFKGWRRKMGVGLLGLACVVAGLWLRSLHIRDQIIFGYGMRAHRIFSIDSRVLWLGTEDLPTAPVPLWQHDSFHNRLGSDSFDDTLEVISVRVMQSQFQNWQKRDFHESRLWDLHYGYIVLPLTLLSAYLILWKPRTKPKEQSHA